VTDQLEAATELVTNLAANLRRLTEEGSSTRHNFLIIGCNPTRNFYVQFLSSVGSAVMLAEAVSDTYVLGGPLTDEQHRRLFNGADTRRDSRWSAEASAPRWRATAA